MKCASRKVLVVRPTLTGKRLEVMRGYHADCDKASLPSMMIFCVMLLAGNVDHLHGCGWPCSASRCKRRTCEKLSNSITRKCRHVQKAWTRSRPCVLSCTQIQLANGNYCDGRAPRYHPAERCSCSGEPVAVPVLPISVYMHSVLALALTLHREEGL